MKGINNKGFTLIELIGIVVVLVAIFLVAFPSLLGTTKQDEEKLYTSMVDDLCLAGETYIYYHMDSFPQLSTPNSIFKLKISTLIEYGNVSKDTMNVKTGNKVINDSLIFRVLSDNSLACEYSDSNITESICSITQDADKDGIADTADMITCGSQNFYVMSNNGTTTTMFAQYNLNVGNTFTYIDSSTQYLSSIQNPDVMQNSQMEGCNEGTYCADDFPEGTEFYGVLSQEDAETYITEYGSKLRTLLGITTESDLSTSMITGTQLEALGCTEYDETSCTYSWVYSTSYWVDDNNNAMEYTGYWTDEAEYVGSFDPEVEEGLSWGYGTDDADLLFGARPVVTILNEYIDI